MIYFVSGIDTDAGKTYCTGWLAGELAREGRRVATQKFVQTGNRHFSEDIYKHRQLTGSAPLPEDLDHTTAPLIFTHPCSPQLAARLDGREIDLAAIDAATAKLAARYDDVLVEGAGGLLVPLTDDFLTIDYAASRRLPLVLVVHGALGSINHTLLSLEAVKGRELELPLVLYNTAFDTDPLIAADTHGFLERYIARHFPGTRLRDVPRLSEREPRPELTAIAPEKSHLDFIP